MPAFTSLAEPRRAYVDEVRPLVFDHGLLKPEFRKPGHFFASILPELQFALLLAAEAADRHPQADTLADESLHALEDAAGLFTPDGGIGHVRDLNSVSFGLVPFTEALLGLRPRTPADRFNRLLEAAVRLFDQAAVHINQTPDYLNPRGMDALAALNLSVLTGEPRFRDRAAFWLDGLVARQYACGAQPYHTAGWIWGRKPAQVYQLLTATMMLAVGRRMDRPDAVAYVERLMDFERIACNRHAEPFITVFEGLHKSHSASAFPWLWPLATALGADRFQPLARAAFERWTEPTPPARRPSGPALLRLTTGFVNALLLEVPRVPAETPPFVPVQGLHACPDISAVFIHQPGLDAALSLLTGYSAIAEGSAGSVKLYALTPELTANPTYRHSGLDAVRLDWKTPSEQDACRIEGGRAVLAGRGFTKWINPEGNHHPDVNLHTRELKIEMNWNADTLELAFRTLRNRHPEPVPSRLLFLLIAQPRDAKPRLVINGETFQAPAAEETGPWFRQASVGPVSFAAPDGSTIEIEPLSTRARAVTAERPDPALSISDGVNTFPRKPCNEGSLRLAFEGPDVLEEGRFRIRFKPA